MSQKIACIDYHLKEYLKQLATPTNLDYFIDNSWLTRTTKGKYIHQHDHGNYDISGVYYLKTNGEDGQLYFPSPHRLLAGNFIISRIVDYYQHLPLENGILAMWPSVLLHNTSTTDMNDLSKVDLPFYCHSFMKRPEQYGYPVIDNPQETHGVVEMLSQILKQNQVPFNSFIRIAVNAVHPQKDVTASIPHVDHTFAHGNLIMYLNNAGGSTFVKNEMSYKDEVHIPQEDDIILFTGEHYMQTPRDKRRVILVATMI